MINIIATFPVLVAEQLTELRDFYVQNFGFEAVFFDARFYVHLQHANSGSQIGFMVPNHPSQPAFLQPIAGTEGMVLSLEVLDAKAAHESAVQAGLPLALDLTAEEFGQTHFMVRDPAGFVVDIVENRAE